MKEDWMDSRKLLIAIVAKQQTASLIADFTPYKIADFNPKWGQIKEMHATTVPDYLVIDSAVTNLTSNSGFNCCYFAGSSSYPDYSSVSN